MPNWFYFTLDVSGKEKDVQEFVQNVKGSEKFETEGSDFDFNHFIPQPDNIFRGALGNKEEEYCKENGLPNWYTWNNENWGTKWNSCHTEIIEDERDGLTYTFDTAWDCPREIIDKLQEILDEELPFISIESWGCVHEDGQEFEQII